MGRLLAIVFIALALAFTLGSTWHAVSQSLCFEGIYTITSSLVGFFNGSDIYLWRPYVSIEGVVLNYNDIGGLLNVTLVFNGVVVDSDTKVIYPNSTAPFYLTSDLSGYTIYTTNTYSIIVSLRSLSDNKLVYACTLASGNVFISGYNWAVDLWSNNTVGNVTVSVMPSIITNRVASPPQIYVYARGLAPFKIYEILAVYPNIPGNPLHLAVLGTGAYGDLYTTLTLPVVTNTSSIWIVVYDPQSNTGYNSTIRQVMLDPPPRTCYQGVTVNPPSGNIVTPPPTTTTSTITSTTTATTVYVTVTKTTTATTTLTSTVTSTLTQTIYVNNTFTSTVTTTVLQNSTLTQTITVRHNSTLTQTMTVTQTNTVENPVIAQASKAASTLVSTGYIFVIGFLALTTAIAASVSILAHRPLFNTIKRIEELRKRIQDFLTAS